MCDDIWDWLNSLQSLGMNPSLDNSEILLARLESPQNAYPSIHVAGSNGKGTCCAILSNSFTIHGTKTGLFTSPHLWSVLERVRIDGKPIGRELFADCLESVRITSLQEPQVIPTYYEATFLVAMLAFRREGVERAIIETGLGGRFDATRHVNADCCILTEIALEHTDILGESLAQIAAEKAAIVRIGYPFIAKWVNDEDARSEIEGMVGTDSTIWVNCSGKTYESDAGEIARRALDAMGLQEISNLVETALEVTTMPGRKQWFTLKGGHWNGNLQILFDAAHNPSGMERIFSELLQQEEMYYPDVILLGCTEQKDLKEFLSPLINFIEQNNITRHLVITEPSSGRREPVTADRIHAALIEDTDIVSTLGRVKISITGDSNQAFELAKKLAWQIHPERNPTLFCTGSLYLIGDLIQGLEPNGGGDNLDILRLWNR